MPLRLPPRRAFSSALSPTPPPTPFPLPLHVGTDLCSIARAHRLLRKSPARFIRRVLTPREIAELPAAVPAEETKTTSAQAVVALLAKGGSLPVNAQSTSTTTTTTTPLWAAATHLAGRFAAKEAAIKAHPHLPSLTLQSIRLARAHDASLSRNGSGPPVAYVTLPATTDDPRHVPTEQEARISISHDGNYATAVCIGFESQSLHHSIQSS